jgi:ABC-type amino acid transport substrate-binding protein
MSCSQFRFCAVQALSQVGMGKTSPHQAGSTGGTPPVRERRVRFGNLPQPPARADVFSESVVTRPGAGVGGPEDLAGLRVLAIDGSTNLALAESFPGAIPVAFGASTSEDVLGEMLALLRAGEVDAVVDDDVCFIEPDPTIELAFTAPTANAWGAACRKGDRADRGRCCVLHHGAGIELMARPDRSAETWKAARY